MKVIGSLAKLKRSFIPSIEVERRKGAVPDASLAPQPTAFWTLILLNGAAGTIFVLSWQFRSVRSLGKVKSGGGGWREIDKDAVEIACTLSLYGWEFFRWTIKCAYEWDHSSLSFLSTNNVTSEITINHCWRFAGIAFHAVFHFFFWPSKESSLFLYKYH